MLEYEVEDLQLGCGTGYWANVTNCLTDPNSDGIVHPGNLVRNCKEKHALLCSCEDLVCLRSPTTSPSSGPTQSPLQEGFRFESNGPNLFQPEIDNEYEPPVYREENKAPALAMTRDGKYAFMGLSRTSAVAVYEKAENGTWGFLQYLVYEEGYLEVSDLGKSLVVSEEGYHLLIGGYLRVAYFTLQNGLWVRTGSYIYPDDDDYGNIGEYMDIDKDGSTFIVTDTNADNFRGAVDVYIRNSNPVETNEQDELIYWERNATLMLPVTYYNDDDQINFNIDFGASLAISDDGMTVCIGSRDGSELLTSRVWIFVLRDGEWVMATPEGMNHTEFPYYFGTTIQFTDNADTLLLDGCYYAEYENGESYCNLLLFERNTSDANKPYTLANSIEFDLAFYFVASGDILVVSGLDIRSDLYYRPLNGNISVFERENDGWTPVQTFYIDEYRNQIDLTCDIATNGQDLLVSGPYTDILEPVNNGGLWAFKRVTIYF